LVCGVDTEQDVHSTGRMNAILGGILGGTTTLAWRRVDAAEKESGWKRVRERTSRVDTASETAAAAAASTRLASI
jgi:hypothetical protein